MLSKEEAIRKHREMWNWIADRIMERKQPVIIGKLKQEYVEQHNESVLYGCYLCNYCIDILDGEEFKERCKYCPLDWESDGDEDGLYQCLDNHDEMGLYEEARRTAFWEEQYKLCKKIANLKEREVGGIIMALAKKCDVCGKLYEGYNEANNIKDVNGIMFLNIDHVGKYFSHRTIDCCPECMKNIKEFIEKLSEVQ